jgi:BirA family transcriptional regulator, biotin operon repressor / biotin---[acetyl-CoA-carboxylase] ligase
LRLAGSAHQNGFRLARHGQLVSTNDEALAWARAGDPGRIWIVAEAQTGGRGRRGRIWASPPGNLYASLLLIDPVPPRVAARLGFAVGVALARTLREILSKDPRLKIKWPNDILYDGAKLAGILLESAVLPDGRFACVAGIGVNCSSHPRDALCKAADLGEILGGSIAPAAVFEPLSAAMARALDVFAAGAGFETIRTQWLDLVAGLGDRIRVASSLGPIEGVFQTIDAGGRLILERPAGRIAIDAGDVFLLPPPTGGLTALP